MNAHHDRQPGPHLVDRLGQHRDRVGEQERHELDDRDAKIGQERGQDRPGAALVHCGHPLATTAPWP